MDEFKTITKTRINPGDLAVDGIFTGIEAGIVMAVFLVVVSAGQGSSPGEVMAAFSFQGSPSLTAGILTHLAVSSIYGILFSLGFHFLNRGNFRIRTTLAGSLAGLAYGFLLWLAADYFPFDRTGTLPKEVPSTLLLAAHLIYGLALGLLVQRRQRSPLV